MQNLKNLAIALTAPMMESAPFVIGDLNKALGAPLSVKWSESKETSGVLVADLSSCATTVAGKVKVKLNDQGRIIFVSVEIKGKSITLKQYYDTFTDSPIESGPVDLAPSSSNYYDKFKLGFDGSVSIQYDQKIKLVSAITIISPTLAKKDASKGFPVYMPSNMPGNMSGNMSEAGDLVN